MLYRKPDEGRLVINCEASGQPRPQIEWICKTEISETLPENAVKYDTSGNVIIVASE